MKKSLFFLSICFIAIQCLAGSNKKYKKIASKYDVPVEAIDLKTDNPSDFWNIILLKNERFTKFQKDIKKNKGAEKEALSEWRLLPRFYPELKYANGVVENYQDFCDLLLNQMGISKLGINCSLHVVNSPELNAYTALTNDGFVMLITTGMLERKVFSFQHIMGIVAHEFTHGIYQHHLQQLYAKAKKKRKNNLLSGIFQGLTAITAGASAFAAGYSGAEFDSTPYTSLMSSIDREYENKTKDYFFVYGREEEYEADIVAFRFLQFMGYHSDYIGALELLGTTNDIYYSNYSDHPKMQDRINLLEYMVANPEEITPKARQNKLSNEKSPKLKNLTNLDTNDWPGELYKELSKKYDFGNETIFRKALQSKEGAKYIYGIVVQEGLFSGDCDTFEIIVGASEKVPFTPQYQMQEKPLIMKQK